MIRFVLIILFVLLSCFASSQTVLSLEECIRIAQENSIEARQAKNNYLIANHDYTLYRKSLLPAVTLSGNLPAFNHAISTITMPDGSESFVTQSVGKYSGALSINQIIPFTGGQFYVSSGLQRLDIYQDNTTTSYLANVINLGLSQSILSYNPYKWKKKIEPIQYEKAKRIYIEKLEE
ncbi:TolC family protein, partial [Bacteroidales bacterium OttesenSCG-928-K22]|nr:TolC family protein [Bacteroidales bacterium OttesenSCG-928-K22]